ncbi:MAG: geranylgeranylglycerol-phosphate geranylgeranyltransferase [Salinivirgaceae bacterium]|nr:geranylgeranylglycerol-phosphate geranylgeranyltransferase [Salinivirgaceae bacterium]
MGKYLSIIRWPNLLMVPLTMYLMRYCIVQPMLDYQFSIQLGSQLRLQLSDGYFFVLVMINVLLGAAGYVINDYYDRRIDTLNHPESVIVGKSIPQRHAIIYHWALNAAAIVLAAIFAWHLKLFSIVLVYMMFAGIFWLYSTTYKRQLLVGNLVVAIVTATIPLQVGLFEYLTLTREYGYEMLLNSLSFMPIMYWMVGFAFFAFITNLIREIVKDMEDLEGDASCGCNTLPMAFGMRVSKIVVVALIALTIAALLAVYDFYLHESLTFIYICVFLIVPLVLAIVLTLTAQDVKHYHRISTLLKVVMLLGVLYSVVVRQIIQFVV